MTTRAPGHQLAAIMFTDIVGYTAIMQQNESVAIDLVNRHQQVLETCVRDHGGEVLQYYGDGSLSIFNSALEAVKCAAEIQTALNKKKDNLPPVPLKIGIHLGEVLFQENKIFGNGINVAARIETLGQAGTVLFSKNIWDNIRNHHEYRAVSLGLFAFKNVEEPLEIFALTNGGLPVPKGKELPGRVKVSGNQRSHWAVGILTAILLLSLSFLFFQQVLIPYLGQPSAGLYGKRVAVMIFDNQTGDENLDPFGRMASDFITGGFMENSQMQVVIPQNVEENIELAAAGNTVSPAFVRATGAELVIEGRYYLQGDQLIVHARAVNVVRKSEVIAVWNEQGAREQLTDVLFGLTQKILGYWALKGKTQLGDKPPRYDAFQEWLQGERYYGWDYKESARHLRRAYALDSSFYVPLLKMIPLYMNQGQLDSAAAVVAYIRAKDPSLGQWEQRRLESFEAVLDGQWPRAAAIYEKMMKIAPGDNITIYMAAYYQNMAGNHARAIEIMQQYQPPPTDKLNFGAALLAEAHYQLGQYREVDEIARSYDFEIYPKGLASLHLASLLHLGETERFDQAFSDYLGLEIEDKNPAQPFLFPLAQMKVIGRPDLLQSFATRLLTILEKNPDDAHSFAARGFIHFLLDDYDHAVDQFQRAVALTPEELSFLSGLGCSYAARGKTDKAKELIENILSIQKPFTEGKPYYEAAKIEACLDNKAEAVRLLRMALRENLPKMSLQDDAFLAPLAGYPPFEEMMNEKR